MSQKLSVSEGSWIPALNSILEDLELEEYSKLLFYLTKIPAMKKKKKSKSSRMKMATVILKYYGLLESISVVDHVMVEIPRMDQRIQDKLRPFVDYLREQENQNQDQNQYKDQDQDKDQGQNKDQNKDQGKKRKHEEKTLCPSPWKRPVLGPRSCQADNVNIPECSSGGHVSQDRKAPWMSISEVKSSGDLEGVTFRGRIIQKSVLLRSKKKLYFYAAVADDTACVKLVVFGKKHHCSMKEGLPYMFSESLIKEGGVVKVTTQSEVMETFSIDVPEEVQLEARHLIYRESPLFSIKDAKEATVRTEVTIEGKVTAIYPAKKMKVHDERKKVKTQKFEVRDETNAIKICMWDEGTHEMDGLLVGDDVKVTNVKVKQYLDTVSLDSTRFTKIHKVQSAGKQEERISIVAVGDHSKEIHLVAELNQGLRRLVVAPQLLAKAFGFKLDGDVRDWLLEHLPLSADVHIQGCKITEITAANTT